MDGTVVVENNTVVLTLFEKVMKIDTRRKHVSIRNKYAIGIVRKDQEILIFDYDRSSRPLVKIKKAGRVMLLRLGFQIAETITVLQNLVRILKAVVEHKPEERPVHYPQLTYRADPRDTMGINKDGKILVMNNTQFKKREEA